jgi:hypothetical protein
MRLASFCFNIEREAIGGAQTPAIAFVKWCGIFGLECDLVSNNLDVNPDIPFVTTYIRDEEELNEYDAVYFSTIDKFGGTNFNYDKLTVPFAVHIHAEFDINLYGNMDRIYKIMQMATVPVVIGLGFWPWHNELLWLPCAQPEYLLDGTEIWGSHDRDGIIYAARLSEWKNAHLLALFSHDTSFTDIYGRIDVYGNANESKYQRQIDSYDPFWRYREGIFNIYDFQSIKARNSQYRYIWDVSGTDSYKLKIPRLNLAAVEGMKFGLVPIVKPESINSEARGACISVNELLMHHDYYEVRERMVDVLMGNNVYTYYNVRKQFARILNALNRG